MYQMITDSHVEFRAPDKEPVQVAKERLAVTFFWHRFVTEYRGTLFFTAERVCQLFQKGRCKYGAECRNVHLCRELWREITGKSEQSIPVPHIESMEETCEVASPRDIGGIPYSGSADLWLLEQLTRGASAVKEPKTPPQNAGPVGRGANGRPAPLGSPLEGTWRSAPGHVPDSLFLSFPMLFAGLSNVSSGSATPSTLPSSPWSCNSSNSVEPWAWPSMSPNGCISAEPPTSGHHRCSPGEYCPQIESWE